MSPHALRAAPELLERISAPADLGALTIAELEELAEEIRASLLSAVAARGGHLGSNLGVVELTIALHRVFRSPTDAIIWDTGHQAYVHKMLTGRQADFVDLRRRGGLSGYPNRSESEHDLVENSHASVGLGYAYGLARARHDARRPGTVVAVVGDGSLTGGVAYEALNNIGWAQLPVVVVLNDNGRSYAPTISRLCGAHGSAPQLVGALGFRYIGPVDGHDLAALEAALEQSSTSRRPVVVHVLTQKGRGYAPAEQDMVKCLHDVAPFDPQTGEALSRRLPTYTDAFTASLIGLAEQRRDIYAITAAMPCSTGLAEFADRFPDRFIDVGIAEQQAVMAAAGLAMGGLRPVVALYSTFLNRAWDQVYYDVGLHALPVVFCIDRAGVTGDDGPSHHGLLDLALLTKVPGMTVLAPSSYEELGNMLRYAVDLGGPVALRWPKGPARRVPGGDVGSGVRAARLRRGGDVCILAVGKLVAAAFDAAERLARADVESSVWDVRSVHPLDPVMLADAAEYGAVVTVEDGIADGGAGAHIAASLREVGAGSPRVRILGAPTRYIPQATPDEILADLGLDGAGISASVLEFLATDRSSSPGTTARA